MRILSKLGEGDILSFKISEIQLKFHWDGAYRLENHKWVFLENFQNK